MKWYSEIEKFLVWFKYAYLWDIFKKTLLIQIMASPHERDQSVFYVYVCLCEKKEVVGGGRELLTCSL